MQFAVPCFVPFVLISDPSVEVCGPSHLASDSDSEVYCDSVDQFSQEEASNNLNPLLLYSVLQLFAHR